MSAAMVIVVSSALAGTGVGGVFNLGVSNSVNGKTTLTGSTTAAQLAVTNTSNAAGSQALSLTGGAATTSTLRASNPSGGSAASFVGGAGKPPFTVNSSTKVGNLNADLLDGLDSTAFLGANAKAADSDKLDGLDSTAFLGANATAANSALLDGVDSSAFLGANAKAADSDKLDGLDSSQFLQGTGAAEGFAIAMPANQSRTYFGKGLRITYFCPSTLSSNGSVLFENVSGDVMNVFFDSGNANPTYVQLADGTSTGAIPALAAGDSFTFHVQGVLHSYGIASINVDTVNRTFDCHFQTQALYTQ